MPVVITPTPRPGPNWGKAVHAEINTNLQESVGERLALDGENIYDALARAIHGQLVADPASKLFGGV